MLFLWKFEKFTFYESLNMYLKLKCLLPLFNQGKAESFFCVMNYNKFYLLQYKTSSIFFLKEEIIFFIMFGNGL